MGLAAAALLVPGARRRALAFAPPVARAAVEALVLIAGLLGWSVLIAHLLGGDVWLSARVTPFTHSASAPYLLGGLALAAAAFAALAVGQSILETGLARRRRLLGLERRLALLTGTALLLCAAAEMGLRVVAVA